MSSPGSRSPSPVPVSRRRSPPSRSVRSRSRRRSPRTRHLRGPERHIDPNAPNQPELQRRLVVAVEQGDLAQFNELLRSVDLNFSVGDVPFLHYCARNADIHFVNTLLQLGLNPNSVDKNGRTPLFYTLRRAEGARDDVQMAALLIRKGANPNIADKNGRTPLFYAHEYPEVQWPSSLLGLGANPNIQDNEGNTPLHITEQTWPMSLTPYKVHILIGDPEQLDSMSRSLRARLPRSDLTIRNNQGQTALMFHVAHSNPDIVEILLRYDPVLKERRFHLQRVHHYYTGLKKLAERVFQQRRDERSAAVRDIVNNFPSGREERKVRESKSEDDYILKGFRLAVADYFDKQVPFTRLLYSLHRYFTNLAEIHDMDGKESFRRGLVLFPSWARQNRIRITGFAYDGRNYVLPPEDMRVFESLLPDIRASERNEIIRTFIAGLVDNGLIVFAGDARNDSFFRRHNM